MPEIAALGVAISRRPFVDADLDDAWFVVREYECRQLWESTLAEWEARAGPRRFDDKRRELEKLKDWWDEAAGQPQHEFFATVEQALL